MIISFYYFLLYAYLSPYLQLSPRARPGLRYQPPEQGAFGMFVSYETHINVREADEGWQGLWSCDSLITILLFQKSLSEYLG